MSLPYSSASSGQNALNDIQKVLRAFNCTKFGTGEDFVTGEVSVQFEHNGQMIMMTVSSKNYAAAWLKENPWNPRKRCSRQAHEQRAGEVGSIAIYSILRDWVKGQVTAIELGLMSFEAAFLPHIVLPNGQRVMDKIVESKMLPVLPNT